MAVKLTLRLPRNTPVYFVENMLTVDIPSLRTSIMGRYTKFCQSLNCHPISRVFCLARIVMSDIRTTTGFNLHCLMKETGLDPLNSTVKMIMTCWSNMWFLIKICGGYPCCRGCWTRGLRRRSWRRTQT